MPVLLSTAFLPPLEYFAIIAEGMSLSADSLVPSVIYLEAFENYQKQSWRNRCRILSSRGSEDLSFPIVHRNGSHNGIPITEVEVDWSGDWLQRFDRAIAAAYGSSAFYEYYRDELNSILHSQPDTLWELNLALMKWQLSAFGLSADIRFTSDYGVCDNSSDEVRDFRNIIHPKKSNTILGSLNLGQPYFQVFTPKFGFTPGLSAIDLLFNEGPASVSYLKSINL